MTSQAQYDNYRHWKEQARVVYEMPLHYIGGHCVTCNGEQEVAAPVLPADATHFIIAARGGAVNYALNGITASATSPGYVAENTAEEVGPLDNLSSLWVYGAGATVFAHIQFFRESLTP